MHFVHALGLCEVKLKGNEPVYMAEEISNSKLFRPQQGLAAFNQICSENWKQRGTQWENVDILQISQKRSMWKGC
jgi:hypothetical protein